MAQFKLTGTIRTSGFGHMYAAYSIIYSALEESGAQTVDHVTREETVAGEESTVLNFSVKGSEEQLAVFRSTHGMGDCILTEIS